MQNSEHLIAYQTVSLAAYQRLRETLIQQSHVFESVMTETQQKAQELTQKLNGSEREGFVLMCSPTLNVLLTAVPTEPHRQPHSKPHSDPQPIEYRVGLTFDDRAIAVFLDRLKSSSRRSLQSETHPMSMQNSRPERKAEVSDDEKMIAQKAFVLSWAKNLAASPESDQQPSQDTLENQVQQSLLLDQVITRIRHSLDLSAILETTVAQVREFLSADRLVLYQFDHFDHQIKGQDHSSLATLPTDEVLASRLTSALDALSLDGLSLDGFSVARYAAVAKASMPQPFAAAMRPTTEQKTYSSAVEAPVETKLMGHSVSHSVVETRSHSGHVTYESRATGNTPSVLHLSETECFSPTFPMLDRYLAGKPVAINNVNEQYAHIPCLLDFLQQAEVKSKIIAPIIVQGQLWGLLIAHQCQSYRRWEETEAIFLQHIAEHLAVAITQASLYQQLRQQTVSLESCVIERTQSLHDALIAAESANITKGEFLSTMSHELRTPLTYIIGMSATLLRWSFGELNDRQRSYLTTINQSGEQLLDVINNILEFASVESGRSILDVSELSLSGLMSTIMAHHKPLADKKKVTLTLATNTAEQEDLFRADAKRLQQIISNLVHNAIKFTDAEGQVKVRVWREPRTAIFQIEDTGIGIPESQQDNLFEKFKQLESPFQRQYAGTGLGLAMTKRLVELHGGSIQIDSQVGKGSTFTVRLPVQSESMPPQPYQIPQLDEGKKRVILLETDEENAAIACEMLTAAGYEVIWLIESDQLAMQLNLLRPVMLIANLSLIDPHISNVKAIQLAITALNAKVLALTNASDSDSASMAHHDILQKPIDPKVLLDKVRKLMLTHA